MLPPDRIPIWSHWARRRFLSRFRQDLAEYAKAVRYEAFPFRVVENDDARAIRRALEDRLARCRRIVRSVATVPLRRLAPTEATGAVAEVDLIRDVFDLARHNLSLTEVDEVLQAAEARYAAGRGAAWRRTLNPLYWIDMTLAAASDLPFLALRLVGRSPGTVARSRGGRLLRSAIRIAVLLGGVWLVLRAIGWHDDLGEVVRGIAAAAGVR